MSLGHILSNWPQQASNSFATPDKSRRTMHSTSPCAHGPGSSLQGRYGPEPMQWLMVRRASRDPRCDAGLATGGSLSGQQHGASGGASRWRGRSKKKRSSATAALQESISSTSWFATHASALLVLPCRSMGIHDNVADAHSRALRVFEVIVDS